MNKRTVVSLLPAFLLALTMAFTPAGTWASDPGHADHEHAEKEPFNAGDYIIHHIADAHSIHLFGDHAEGIPEVSIPLPIILWTDNGLKMFMSSAFHHDDEGKVKVDIGDGMAVVNYHEKILYAADEADAHGSFAAVDHETHAAVGPQPLDLSITKSVAGMLLMMILLVILMRAAAKGYKKRPGQAPTGIQNALEPLILFVRDEIAIPSIGEKKAAKFLPFLLTVFFFIWLCNLLGLVPFLGGFNITGTLGVTVVLAAFVFIITSINGNKHYWMHILWPPGVPVPIKLILVPVEIAGLFIKPIVLMIRLTANISAGHIVILAFVSLVLMFGEQSVGLGYGVGVGAIAFMIFMFFLELLVAFLQAYVFTMLAALYFGDATQDAHH